MAVLAPASASIPLGSAPSQMSTAPIEPSMLSSVYEKTKSVWSYLGKSLGFSRQSLNASLRIEAPYGIKNTSTAAKVAGLFITHSKLASLIEIPISCESVKNAAQKVFAGIKRGDGEGIALSSLSFVIIAADLIDTLGMVLNTTLSLTCNVTLEFISVIGMPFAFGMSGLGAISRSIQIAKTTSLSREILGVISKKSITEQIREIRDFVLEKLGPEFNIPADLDPEKKVLYLNEVKEAKKAALLRAAPPEAVAEFEAILGIFEQNEELKPEEMKKVFERLDIAMFHLDKKTKLDIANLMCNILTLIGLTLFFVAVPPALPFIFIAASLLLRIACVAYGDISQHKPKDWDTLLEEAMARKEQQQPADSVSLQEDLLLEEQ